MKDLPVVMKALINVVLYVLYVLVASIIFSIVFPLILQGLGKEVLNPNDPIFAKIQIFIAILVLIISLILRKYFYLLGGNKDVQKVYVEKESYVAAKTAVPKKTVKKTQKTVDQDDEEIKIYVEKEIK